MILFNILAIPPAHANIREGLMGWWKMEEATGINVVDSSGNGNTGTVVNSPTSTPNCARGKCLSFNGSSNYVSLPATLAPASHDWACSFWAKAGAPNGYAYWDANAALNRPSVAFMPSNSGTNKPYFHIRDAAGNTVTVYDITYSGPVTNDSKWYHFVGILSSKTLMEHILVQIPMHRWVLLIVLYH